MTQSINICMSVPKEMSNNTARELATAIFFLFWNSSLFYIYFYRVLLHNQALEKSQNSNAYHGKFYFIIRYLRFLFKMRMDGVLPIFLYLISAFSLWYEIFQLSLQPSYSLKAWIITNGRIGKAFVDKKFSNFQ